jgi:chromosome segregation ATPase
VEIANASMQSWTARRRSYRVAIMIEWVMFFCGGFLVALLLALLLISAVHNRAVRLTRRSLKNVTVPKSLQDVQTENDALRAQYAVLNSGLQTNIEQLKFKTVTQLAELGRKEQAINRLKSELVRNSMVNDKLAEKVVGLTKQNQETLQRADANAAELTAVQDALAAKDVELAQVTNLLSEHRLVIDTKRLEIGTLNVQTEQLILKTSDLERIVAAKNTEVQSQADRIVDIEEALAKKERLLSWRAAEINALFREMATLKKEATVA